MLIYGCYLHVSVLNVWLIWKPAFSLSEVRVVICIISGGLDNTKQNNVTQKWGFMSFVLLVCVWGGGGLDNTNRTMSVTQKWGFMSFVLLVGNWTTQNTVIIYVYLTWVSERFQKTELCHSEMGFYVICVISWGTGQRKSEQCHSEVGLSSKFVLLVGGGGGGEEDLTTQNNVTIMCI